MIKSLLLSSKMPGASHGAAQHSVGLLIVDELLFFGIPAEFSAESYSDIVQVADGVGADGGIYGADCLLPALDAFDEIAAVIVASRQADFIRTYCSSQQGFRLGGDKAALDQDPAFIAHEKDSKAIMQLELLGSL